MVGEKGHFKIYGDRTIDALWEERDRAKWSFEGNKIDWIDGKLTEIDAYNGNHRWIDFGELHSIFHLESSF